MSQVSVKFQATKSQQQFTVPSGVSSIFMQCWGAFGGDRSLAVGSASFAGVGYVDGRRAVTPGQTFYVYVGGQGLNEQISSRANQTVSSPGGWNGGGAGGTACTNNAQVWRISGNGGGGATDIRYGGTSTSNRILVAGGAGGSGQNMFFNSQNSSSSPEQNLNPTSPNPPYTGATNDWYYNSLQDQLGGTGGHGGPSVGQWGGPSTWINALTQYGCGGPGSQTAGGRGSILNSVYAHDGKAGSVGQGGAGANVTSSDAASQGLLYGGGGGGGGYYGGGGGSTDYGKNTTLQGANGAGGGGGGSNYVGSGFVTSQSLGHTQNPLALAGGSYFDGYAMITYDQPPNSPYVTAPMNNTFFDNTQPLTLKWKYSSNDGSTWQQGFEIDFQAQGATSWNSFPTVASKNGSYTFPAGLFNSGTTYNFRIRYYDNTGDPSPFSTLQLTAVTLNAPLTITAPPANSVINSTMFNVTWTPPANEELVRIKVLDPDGKVLFNSNDKASTRVNLCSGPNADSNPAVNSFGGVGSMTLQPQTYGGSITASTDINARGVSGGKSYKIAWGSTSDPTYMASFRWITTVPGETYNVSLGYAKSNASGAEVQLSVTGRNTYMGDTSSLGTTVNTFQQLTCTFVADASYAFINVSTNGPTVLKTDYGYIDAILVEQGAYNTPQPNFTSYFDGNNANGQSGTPSWLGWSGSSSSALTPATPYASQMVAVNTNTSQEQVTVQVSYTTTTSSGLWSNIASENVLIDLNPPATPTATIFSNSEEGTISLNIVNPDGANPTNPTAYNDIYRQDLTNGGDLIRIATDVPVNSVFVDYTPATETTYAYKVRAVSTNGGFADTQ